MSHNSPVIQSEIECKFLRNLGENIDYSFHPENTPLAIVYNSIISQYQNIDYIAIFDQDTVLLDADYEKKLDSAIENNPQIDLLIPKIYTKMN